jgi:hypothetical protein
MIKNQIEAFLFSLFKVPELNDRLKCLKIKANFETDFFNVLD